jgi:OOP family OmpA-OmpF porin
MKQQGKSRYLIEGHTDDRGGAAMNQGLSERRAASVKAWLVKAGIDAGRLETKGFGMSKPALPNDSEAGRAANRRVEVAVAR